MDTYIKEYNDKEYDYSHIDVNNYISYGNKVYITFDDLLKNVFVTTHHYSNVKLDYISNNFVKDEKVCIYKWFVVRSQGENMYRKCEILITTYGRVLYAVSQHIIDSHSTMLTSISISKEYNFWLSKCNINILKLILDSRPTVCDKTFEDEQTDTHFTCFERLIKSINGVFENMKHIEKHKRTIEFNYPYPYNKDNHNKNDTYDDNVYCL